ncbi:MAG: hypothetical protein WDA74_06860 [Spirochaetota bacterium]
MNKFSFISALILAFFLTLSGFVFAQEVEDNAEATGITEQDISEDTAVEQKEKIFEKEDVLALKGTPKTFTDGYNTYVNDKIQFRLSDIDNIMQDKIFYRINDENEQEYTGPFSLKDEGSQVIYYYSIDKMGNREELRSLNVIVDKTAPEVIVTIAAPFAKTDGKVYASDKFKYDYAISAKDNISGVGSVGYAIEDGEYMEYLKPFSINSEKPVNINIAAEDRVGNLTKKHITKIVDEDGNVLAESFDDIEIIVDKTAPLVEITPDREFYMKDSTKIASKDYKYTITATDDESGVKAIYYRIDSRSEFILYTGPIQFNTNGWHKIEAIARDGVGNVSKTAVLDVFVDLIPAQTNIELIAE